MYKLLVLDRNTWNYMEGNSHGEVNILDCDIVIS